MEAAEIQYILSMFPDARNPEQKTSPAQKRLPKNYLLYGTIAVIVLLAAAAVALAIGLANARAVKIPEAIAQKFKPTIYLPSKLPGKYQISEATFDLTEEDTVLIFNATDGINGDLVFTEQTKPVDFDFDNFHKSNFENPQTLNDVPYPSVWGKTINNRLSLSIVTDDTWIMMTTSAPLNADDIQRIASGIKK